VPIKWNAVRMVLMLHLRKCSLNSSRRLGLRNKSGGLQIFEISKQILFIWIGSSRLYFIVKIETNSMYSQNERSYKCINPGAATATENHREISGGSTLHMGSPRNICRIAK
jgi:hypothetical protein